MIIPRYLYEIYRIIASYSPVILIGLILWALYRKYKTVVLKVLLVIIPFFGFFVGLYLYMQVFDKQDSDYYVNQNPKTGEVTLHECVNLSRDYDKLRKDRIFANNYIINKTNKILVVEFVVYKNKKEYKRDELFSYDPLGFYSPLFEPPHYENIYIAPGAEYPTSKDDQNIRSIDFFGFGDRKPPTEITKEILKEFDYELLNKYLTKTWLYWIE